MTAVLACQARIPAEPPPIVQVPGEADRLGEVRPGPTADPGRRAESEQECRKELAMKANVGDWLVIKGAADIAAEPETSDLAKRQAAALVGCVGGGRYALIGS